MRHTLLGVAALVSTFAGAAKGQSAVHPGYPNVNESLEIAPGETVRLLNRILVDRTPGLRSIRRMDFQYRTTIPAGNAAARAAQADRAAQVLGAQALDAGARTLAIALCDSDACGRRDEPPRVWYIYELRSGNVWKRVPN